MELLQDYDLVIDYHSGKANVVVDALSCKPLPAPRAINAHFDFGSIVASQLNFRFNLLFFQESRHCKIKTLNLDPMSLSFKITPTLELILKDFDDFVIRSVCQMMNLFVPISIKKLIRVLSLFTWDLKRCIKTSVDSIGGLA
ncbi:hypothetical protein HRI_000267900 [Hibiscus trionum]|uniref:Uncharacterized protein n=1 Tax=Hibiscus trionum TaxID=183268 RepID=A0A9W7GW88_HIBTR|nr:hypothetical protein HRI_000267900 [Hibiscus trionum]